MRAKFIRGQNPKKSMELGVDGEVQKVGYYDKFADGTYPIQEPSDRAHELFKNWDDLIDNNYVFRYREIGEEDWADAHPLQLSGKRIIYDGQIYTIPVITYIPSG